MNDQNRKIKTNAYEMLGSGRASDAKDVLEKLCKTDRKDAEAWMLLGCVYGSLGESSGSINALRKSVKLKPDSAEAYGNLAIALRSNGLSQEALEVCRKAIQLRPDIAAFYSSLGSILKDIGDMDGAIAGFRKAIELQPESASDYYNLGNALNSTGLMEQALEAYQHAIRINPRLFQALNNMGNVYVGLGRLEEGEASYNRALAVQPGFLDAISGKARVLDKSRKYEDAYNLVKPYLDAKTKHAGLAVTFADFSHYLGKEGGAIEWMEDLAGKEGFSDREMARLHFALGKLRDREGSYDSAFRYFEHANSFSKMNFDINKHKSMIDSIIEVFNVDSIAHYLRAGRMTDLPVFIVGMPRSGTSLVEQILASHPEIAGAGELEEMNTLAASIPALSGLEGVYPTGVDRLSQAQINALSEQYISVLRNISVDAKRITDKMPTNYLYPGLIQMLFPRARIIHCQRNSLDTCLSCYFQDFSGHHPYASNLVWLGNVYKQYVRLMEHWVNVLEIDVMQVQYEDMVANQEMTSRKLIEFCGLEWDDACLRFYESNRPVATSSYDQVRRPVYTSSLDRWKHYEKYISPLKEILGVDNDR